MSYSKILFYSIVFALFVQSISLCQFQNVRISNLYDPNEPSIMINPKNPNQIVAGANNNRFFPDSSFSGYYYSTNGGLNWAEGPIKSNLAGPGGDPCIVVDTNGYFYYTQNVFVAQTSALQVVLIAKSTNGGANWPLTNIFGQNDTTKQDKPWACVDFSHGVYGNNIYVTWTAFDHYGYPPPGPSDSSRIVFSKSTNSGVTWSAPVRLDKLGGDCNDKDNTVEGAVPCVGPNGEVYVSWAGPKIRNSQFGIFFNKSTDEGQTWLANPIYVTDQPGGWDCGIVGTNRANGFPVTCCDVSNGPYRGTIYINYVDSLSPGDHDVKLIKSTNGGLNWSSVKRVNNDPAGKEQFLTWMTIDQTTGYLYFVFYDRRNYSNTNTDVYLVRSTDGGQTFGNAKISQTPFAPNSNVFLGDYICISAYNNKIRPVWTRIDGGNTSIWTAIIDTLSIGIRNFDNQIPDKYSLFQNYPNPFNPSTKIKFEISKPGDIKLNVYDVTGKNVSRIVNEYLTAGTYEVTFDARQPGLGSNLTSDIYFYRLISGNYTETKKMILLK